MSKSDVLLSLDAVEFMQINIADRDYAKYVENHVPRYIWKVISFYGFNCCMIRRGFSRWSYFPSGVQFNEADYDFCRRLLPKTMRIEIIFNVTFNVLTPLSLMQESLVFVMHPVLLVRYITFEHIKTTVLLLHHLIKLVQSGSVS